MRINFLIILLLLTNFAAAEETQSLVLLTIAEDGENQIGGTANLFLDKKPGSGRIFIDSFPLTKLDTQISTRFANEIACQQIEKNCDKYDFFYTIRADSTIIGGPSAGLGISLLTAASVLDIPANESITVTGTINSGGIVGPVSGVYQKIYAAQNKGLEKAIIPNWAVFNESLFENETGTNLTMEIVKVSNFDEAFYEYSGVQLNEKNYEIKATEKYKKRMKAVADILCGRTDAMLVELASEGVRPYDKNFTEKRANTYAEEKYYSVASFCFSKNVELRKMLLENTDLTSKLKKISQLTKAINKLDQETDKKELRTLSDLETYMVVKERLVDTATALSKINLTEVPPDELGYVIERYFSAFAWSQFFGLGGTSYNLEQDQLKDACEDKILEAEERLDYVGTISPTALISTREGLGLAYRDRDVKNYALCIFKAIKAKAEANTFLMAVNVFKSATPDFIDEKLHVTEKIIAEQQSKNIFPILGYSYYEYAKELKETDLYSSLMFSEYSLEMSNLDLYFPKEEKFSFPTIDLNKVGIFVWGLVLGFIAGFLVNKKTKKKPRKKRK